MAEETLYTIGELAELAGVTPRTIRYYTAEGLLPRPDARGQYALYSPEHLLRLRLIGQLKAGYLPLGAIKARIEHLSADEIRTLLGQQEPPPPPDSAAEYVARLLSAPARQQLAEAPLPYQLPGAPPGGSVAQPQANLAAAAPAQPMPPHRLAEMPAPAPALAVALQAPHAEMAIVDADQWRRITIEPGVELHIREPLNDQQRRAVERLIAFGRTLFGREGS